METTNFGFEPSKIDGTERIYKASKTSDFPSSYTYKSYLPPVLNQGSLSICVPCSISAYLNWKENMKNHSNNDINVDLMSIYNARTNKSNDGMTFKAAFKYLRHNGVKSNNGNLMIDAYGLIKSINDLKSAIVSNGPCVGALPVYSDKYEFWNSDYGNLQGYHAISIVGFDEKGFYIRNSWGKYFGKGGYTYISNDDFSKFIEIWTIIE